MSKLVDKERLAQLAKALDARMKAAVAAEAVEARAAEQAIEAKADANTAAIAKLNGGVEEEGSVAKAIAKAVKAEEDRAVEAENSLGDRIDLIDAKFEGGLDDFLEGLGGDTTIGGMMADINANKAKLEGIEEGKTVIAAIEAAVEDEKDLREEKESELAGKIAALELKVNGGEGEGQDSIYDKIAAAQKAAEAKAAELDDILKSELQENIDAKVAQAEYDTKIANFEGRIAAFEGDENKEGSVKNQIKVAVEAEADRAKKVEEDHESRIAANEAFVAAQPAVDAEQNRRLGVLEADAPVKQAAIEAAQKAADNAQDAADAAQADADALEERLDAEGGLVDRIEANEANIARLDGAADVEGSVKKQIADAIAGVKSEVTNGLTDRVEELENFKDVTYPAAEQKVREDFAAADEQVLADAKKYADEEITKLVDSAPDAMNTLNELAEAIKGNKDVYDAYVEQHAAAMTKMKEDLQKEIDDDVKAVVDAQKLVNDAQAEINEDIEERVAANEAFVAAQPAIDQEQDRRIKALEDANKEGGDVAKAIAAAQKAADDAQDAADAAQADVDAIEQILDNDGGLVDRLEAAEAAIEAEVKEGGARDAAIDAALEAYSTTEEMKTILGNVVNSLALTMENDQVVLKLGGEDGIALASVSLDVATKDDIDAIIAGLDEVAGE